MSDKELESLSIELATKIRKTPVDLRANLFSKIAWELRNQSQGYTSNLFDEIANTYGIKKK